LMPPTLSTVGNGPFTSSCITWVTVDGKVYGNVGIDEFVFNVDETGIVKSIAPLVLRTTLSKT
jgi:hypothetical protein